MEQKLCFKCGKLKPLSDFYKHKQSADGYLGKCKECARRDVAIYRKQHPERELDTRLKACGKSPSHRNANLAVDAAVRSGRLEKPERCQGCGRSISEARLSAHHFDYRQPLSVIWVCAACHKHLDSMRAVVESGKSMDEWRREKNAHDCKARRALAFYKESGKERRHG